MKKILFVLANKYFQDFEFRIPKDILIAEWYEIFVCAELLGTCTGVFGYQVEATIALADAQWTDYAMIVFIGGGWALQQYQGNSIYLHLAQQAKLLWAICIAPSLISDAGVLKGKQCTGRDDEYWTWKTYIERNGWIYLDKPVVVDWSVVTANGPQSAEAFWWELVHLLKRN